MFASPGSVGETFSAGCNNLIKSNKAHLLTSVKDVEYIMGWDAAKPQKKAKVSVSLDGYDDHEQTVLKIMIDKKANVLIDELSWKANLPVSQLASVLLGLEFKGVVKSMPGKQYQLAN